MDRPHMVIQVFFTLNYRSWSLYIKFYQLLDTANFTDTVYVIYFIPFLAYPISVGFFFVKILGIRELIH